MPKIGQTVYINLSDEMRIRGTVIDYRSSIPGHIWIEIGATKKDILISKDDLNY